MEKSLFIWAKKKCCLCRTLCATAAVATTAAADTATAAVAAYTTIHPIVASC